MVKKWCNVQSMEIHPAGRNVSVNNKYQVYDLTIYCKRFKFCGVKIPRFSLGTFRGGFNFGDFKLLD